MTVRRFDTDSLLDMLLENDEKAFRAFYERYRGRVYRYIVRQCGNSEQDQKAYLSIWAQLINNRLDCASNKSLKRAFLKSLQDCLFRSKTMATHTTQPSLMPGELEEGGRSTLLIDLIKRLPEGHRMRLLFRYEIGLSQKAIASLFDEEGETTKNYLDEAEGELLHGLSLAGRAKRVSLDLLYRETRLLRPPASWDRELIKAYPAWFKGGVPESLIKIQESEAPPERLEVLKARVIKVVRQIRSELAERLLIARDAISKRH
ncbi:MAG: hypothetical protein ABFR65_07705 [Pseudomonadota bacterium]